MIIWNTGIWQRFPKLFYRLCGYILTTIKLEKSPVLPLCQIGYSGIRYSHAPYRLAWDGKMVAAVLAVILSALPVMPVLSAFVSCAKDL